MTKGNIKRDIKEGSFLVRDSRTEPGSYAFSIKTKANHVTHVKIYKNMKGSFQLEGKDDDGQRPQLQKVQGECTYIAKQFGTILEKNYKKKRTFQPTYF